MPFPYSGDAEGEQVLRLSRDLFLAKGIFASSNRHLIFVCGGDRTQHNLRSQFLTYAQASLPHLRLILAEDAYTDLLASSRTAFVNLALFEQLVADLSDCVIMFPESTGSFAEFGYFVGNSTLTKKLLAVNPLKYQAHDSFLNLGPIALVNERSDFRPTLHINDSPPIDFSDIKKRLARYSAPRRRMAFTHKSFNSYSSLERLFAIFEALKLLRTIHTATLPYALKAVFDEKPEKDNLKHLLSILIAAKYVRRAGADARYLVANDVPSFLELPNTVDTLAASNQYLLAHHGDVLTAVFP